MVLVLFAVLVLVACGDRGSAPPGGDKPAEQKAPVSPDGFEQSWFGHLSKVYDGPLLSCVDVAKTALRRLGIEITEEKGGLFETTFEAEGRDGTSLIVILKELSPGTTRITVKVGYLLGDRDAAQRIHSEIQTEFAARKARTPWSAGAATPGSQPPARPGGGTTP